MSNPNELFHRASLLYARPPPPGEIPAWLAQHDRIQAELGPLIETYRAHKDSNVLERAANAVDASFARVDAAAARAGSAVAGFFRRTVAL